MKTKHGLLTGFAVIAIAAMFTLAGCKTDAEEEGLGGNTIALEKEGNNVLVLTLSSGEWDGTMLGTPLDIIGEVGAGSLSLSQVQTAGVVQSNKRVLKITVTQSGTTTGTFTYSLKDSGDIVNLMMNPLVSDFGSSNEEWKAVSGKKGPVSITIGGAGEVPGGDELWGKFTAGSGTWTKGDITLTFTYEETETSRGYANLNYTTTVYMDGNHDLYVKLNSASSWYMGQLDGSKNIAFNGSDAAGTVTFASATSMTISGISASEFESMYNGTYTRQ